MLRDGLTHNRLSFKGLMETVRATVTGSCTLGIFWLGQAGFILKTPAGAVIAIDPYLSDSCERLVGYKRIMRPVLCPEELEADYLFISHEHPDHFDEDLIAVLKEGEQPKLFGPPTCREKAVAAGMKQERFVCLEEDRPIRFDEFVLLPVKADHGEACADALGFILDFGFVKIYFAGDTAFSPEMLKTVYACRPEIALLPINGEFGNLNPAEAAQLAGEIGARVLLPCHFWTFVEHGACPLQLMNIMERELPHVQLLFLAQGEGYIYRAAP